MTIEAAYANLVSVVQWINGRFNELNIADNDRARIAAGCFDMVLEYQASIALQVRHQMKGSALSILRLEAEAFLRGMWFARCATDDDVVRFRQTDLPKRLPDMVGDIEIALGGATDTLSKMVKSQWGPLSGFTHTGFKQIACRYKGNVLTPNFPDAEVIQGLNFAASIGLMAALELATLSNNDALGRATLERARQFGGAKTPEPA
jgi:hypothetical protein